METATLWLDPGLCKLVPIIVTVSPLRHSHHPNVHQDAIIILGGLSAQYEHLYDA
jgi:hypothetical protein